MNPSVTMYGEEHEKSPEGGPPSWNEAGCCRVIFWNHVKLIESGLTRKKTRETTLNKRGLRRRMVASNPGVEERRKGARVLKSPSSKAPEYDVTERLIRKTSGGG